MADRQLPELRSRLRLDTSDLLRAQGAAEKFVNRLNSIDAKGFDKFSAKADQFGDKMNRNVTLPVLAAGAAASKLAVDFDTSFTQMQTLAGVTADEVEGLKEKVKELAVETGRSPDELAKALYFIRSSGLDGADALNALEASAKGAAIGLGDAAGVADAITSAINTYGAANLDGAKATDILAAAVAEGKGEASEFAPQLGRLLPIAKNLGVGFDQVAGSMAFLTKNSGDTSLASAQLGGVLAAILKPTQQGAKQLEEMGLTANYLRDSVASKGLLPTLQLLSDKLGGNKDALGRLFEDREALTGFLGLTQNASETAATIDKVTESSGYLNDAMGKIQEDPGFQLKQSLAELQVAGIELGERLLPALISLAETGADVLDFFSHLPPSVQTATLVFVGLAAALGPIAKLAANGATAISFMMKAANSNALQGVAGQAGTLGALAGPAGAAVVVLSAGLFKMAERAAGAAAAAAELEAGVKSLRGEAEATGKSIEDVFVSQSVVDFATENADALAKLGFSLSDIRDGLTGSQKDYDAFIAKIQGAGKLSKNDDRGLLEQFQDIPSDPFNTEHSNGNEQGNLIGGFNKLRDQLVIAKKETRAQEKAEADLDLQHGDTAGSTDDLAASFGDLGTESASAADEMEEQRSKAEGLYNAQTAAADSAAAVADAQQGLAEAQRAAAGDSDAMRSALEGVADAEKGVADAQASSRDAEVALSEARRQSVEDLEDLERAARGAVVSENGARLALQEAQRDQFLLVKGDDYFADQNAAQKVAEAQQALADASDKRGDTQAELDRVRVQGTDAVRDAQERLADAHDAERDAEERVGEASKQVAQVRADAAAQVEEATKTLTAAQLDNIDKQAEVVELTFGAVAGNNAMITGLESLAATLDPASPLRQRLQSYIDDLKELQDLAPVIELDANGKPTRSIASLGSGRAQGGPVYPGRSYEINERARHGVPREVFVPDVQGRIVAGSRDGGSAPTITMPITVLGNPDAATIAEFERAGGRMIDKALRQFGKGFRG